MSNLGQVEGLIIGASVSTEATLDDFITSAADKDIGIFSMQGDEVEAGKAFRLYQKTGDTESSSGYEFSSKVIPTKVERVTVVEYAAEIQKEVEVGIIDAGNILPNHTYVVEVILYNPNGAFSVENFEVISGYYVTGSGNIPSAEDVMEGLEASLSANLTRRGGNEFVVTDDAGVLTIAGKEQRNVPGKDEGRAMQFEVNAKVFDNSAITNENLGYLTTEVTVPYKSGKGTGKYATNLEWFVKGFTHDVYRETAYPANFASIYYANIGSTYNVIHILHYDDRISPTVERQYKTLTVLIEGADTAATNAVLAELRKAIDTDRIPVDLV